MSVDKYHYLEEGIDTATEVFVSEDQLREAHLFMKFAESKYPVLARRIDFGLQNLENGDHGTRILKNQYFGYFYRPAKYFYNFPYKELGVPLRRKDEEEKIRRGLSSAVRDFYREKNPFQGAPLKEAAALGDIICRIYDGDRVNFIVK